MTVTRSTSSIRNATGSTKTSSRDIFSFERGPKFFKPIYLDANRRFIVGTLAYQNPFESLTFELWEGDLISAEQIQLTYEVINKLSSNRLRFKPNSLRQDERPDRSRASIVSCKAISRRTRSIWRLTSTKAFGRIHIIDKMDDHVEIGYNEILVLDEFPVNFRPCRHYHVATFDAAFAHQPAREGLGNSKRLHQKREGTAQTVRRLVGVV